MQGVWAPALAAAVYAAVGALPSVAPNLRITNTRIAETVSVLLLRSPTFAASVRRLKECDVIVYGDPERCPTKPVQSCLTMMGNAGGHRYLRISISIDGPKAAIAAHLAHELRHALEIADEPGVSDSYTMRA